MITEVSNILPPPEGGFVVSRGDIIANNILSVLVMFPSLGILLFLAGMGSDAGPNILSEILLVVAFVVFLFVLVAIVMSQIEKSLRWAKLGIQVVIMVPIISLVLVFVSLYIHGLITGYQG